MNIKKRLLRIFGILLGLLLFKEMNIICLPQDIEVLATYIREVLGGHIGRAYQSTEGRITIN